MPADTIVEATAAGYQVLFEHSGNLDSLHADPYAAIARAVSLAYVADNPSASGVKIFGEFHLPLPASVPAVGYHFPPLASFTFDASRAVWWYPHTTGWPFWLDAACNSRFHFGTVYSESDEWAILVRPEVQVFIGPVPGEGSLQTVFADNVVEWDTGWKTGTVGTGDFFRLDSTLGQIAYNRFAGADIERFRRPFYLTAPPGSPRISMNDIRTRLEMCPDGLVAGPLADRNTIALIGTGPSSSPQRLFTDDGYRNVYTLTGVWGAIGEAFQFGAQSHDNRVYAEQEILNRGWVDTGAGNIVRAI